MSLQTDWMAEEQDVYTRALWLKICLIRHTVIIEKTGPSLLQNVTPEDETLTVEEFDKKGTKWTEAGMMWSELANKIMFTDCITN